MKNCTSLWREAHFQVKMYKAPHVRTAFGVEKVHTVVAQHISKLKCTKHHMFGPLLEVQMSFRRQAQGVVHRIKSEQNVRVLPWQAQ